MLDILPEVKQHLEYLLPVYSEKTEQPVSTPCISYFLYNDNQQETGDTIIYSSITVCIKVWDHNIGNMMANTLSVDEIMRLNGYKRVSVNTMSDDGLYCNVLLFRGLGKEFI